MDMKKRSFLQLKNNVNQIRNLIKREIMMLMAEKLRIATFEIEEMMTILLPEKIPLNLLKMNW